MPVQVQSGGVVERDLAKRGPVAVCGQRQRLGLFGSHRETRRREGNLAASLYRDKHGDVARREYSALAAPGIAAHDREAVPALRHGSGERAFILIRVVNRHPVAVDAEGEVVVKHLADSPRPRLRRRHEEPAVEAQLRVV